MLTKDANSALGQIEFISIEDMVPQRHLVRTLAAALDFRFVYDEVKDLYCADNGRPSLDPVVLFKIVFLQYTFGIKSMLQTIKEIEVNMAYRWFLGFGFHDKVPHFGTFSKNYARRFEGSDIFERVFGQILQEAVACGFLDTEAAFIDSTPVKANANKKKKTEVIVKKKVHEYKNELEREIQEDRRAHEKKDLDFPDDGDAEHTVTKSKTDPDSGVLRKGEHETMFAYSAHTVCDKNNFILAATVTAANVHDSTEFGTLYDKLKARFPDIPNIVLDAAFKTPWIAKRIFDDGKTPYLPYKRQMTKEGFFKKYEYTYDPYYDHYVCPNGEILSYSTTNREGYREYKSHSETCKCCPSREICTHSRNTQKIIARHVLADYLDKAEEIRRSQEWKTLYPERSRTIERVFADAKEKHGMRYARYRGVARVTMQILMTYAAMNLKKLATWKAKRTNNTAPPFPRLKTIMQQLLKFYPKPRFVC